MFLVALGLALFFGWLTDDTAKRKGYSGGFWWGFFLSFIGYFIVALRPDNQSPDAYMNIPTKQSSSQTRNDSPQQPSKNGHVAPPDTGSSGWTCVCGAWNPDSASSCKNCYLQKSEALKPKLVCPVCGAPNRYDLNSCYACGCPLPREHAASSSGSAMKSDPPKAKPVPATWTCTCGSVNPITMKSCPSCFKSKDWINEGTQGSAPESDPPRQTRRRRNPSSAAQDAQDYISVLEQLGKLHDQGILTDEEFAQKKADILSKM